jgi:hypothetical protein
MPTIAPSQFNIWIFNDEELKQATMLTDLQQKRLETLQAQITQSLLNIEAVSDAELREAETQRAFFKGQLKILDFLIEQSQAQHLEVNTEEYERSQQQAVQQFPKQSNLYQHFTQQEKRPL